MPIYQTNDYTFLQIKEKKTSLMNSRQRWIKHETYTYTNEKKNIYNIQISSKKVKTLLKKLKTKPIPTHAGIIKSKLNRRTQSRKSNCSGIRKYFNTHAHTCAHTHTHTYPQLPRVKQQKHYNVSKYQRPIRGKLSDRSRGWPEGFLFDSLLHSIPGIDPLYSWSLPYNAES